MTRFLLAALALTLIGLTVAALALDVRWAPMPDAADIANPIRRTVSTDDQAGQLHGAGPVDDALLRLGREAFWRETFGNEVFLTDVLGLLDGAIGPVQIARAVLALGGAGTTNLEVRVRRDVVVGDRAIPRGTPVPTGLDVPPGGLVPLGIAVAWERGRLRAGITCALCHAALDPATGKVVEGAPNADLQAGLVIALAANSASYFGHVDRRGLEPFLSDPAGGDAGALEREVDRQLAAWPAGHFDSTVDLVNNPTQIPDSFTGEAWPFGWSGFALAGPFRGSSSLSNNVHSLNSDALTQADSAPLLFGLDKEAYLRLLLRRAPAAAWRWRPEDGRSPSAVAESADPSPMTPGVNTLVRLPTWPDPSFVATEGLVISLPGFTFGRHLDAISAFEASLRPPPAPPADAVETALRTRGAEIFAAAGCDACHAGQAGTDHSVRPVAEIGTEPSRARALRGLGPGLREPVWYPPTTPVPLPPGATALPVPLDAGELDTLALGWGLDGSGGYKVKALVGLAWTAPYLHDGGVAVGPDWDRDLGVPGTTARGIRPDPAASLEALLDRELRARVVAANAADPDLALVHTTGAGHPFWVDAAAGWTDADRAALIAHLLAWQGP